MKANGPVTRCEAKALPTGSELYLYGDIGGYFADGITADAVKGQLEKCSGDLSVYVNSPGGSVFEGLAIYNQLKRYGGGQVTCYVDGLAASIASIIAMAGTRCEMSPASMMMVHNAQSAVMGSSADMRKCADDLDVVTSTIRGVYTGKSGMSDEDVSALMDAETWLTAEDCVKRGFADAITEEPDEKPKRATACAPRILDTYKNTPAALRQVPQATAVAETLAEMGSRAESESLAERESRARRALFSLDAKVRRPPAGGSTGPAPTK